MNENCEEEKRELNVNKFFIRILWKKKTIFVKCKIVRTLKMESVALWLEVFGEPSSAYERIDRRVIRNTSNIMRLSEQR